MNIEVILNSDKLDLHDGYNYIRKVDGYFIGLYSDIDTCLGMYWFLYHHSKDSFVYLSKSPFGSNKLLLRKVTPQQVFLKYQKKILGTLKDENIYRYIVCCLFANCIDLFKEFISVRGITIKEVKEHCIPMCIRVSEILEELI